MTSNTPDRMHIALHRDCDNNVGRQTVPHHGPLDGADGLKYDWYSYLLSTPARENADNLLSVLTKVRDACLVDDPHGVTVETEVIISYELFAEMQDAIDKGNDND